MVQAGALGLTGERVQMLVAAVHEATAYLLAHGTGGVAARTWAQAGAIVCDLHQPSGKLADPFLGFRPLTSEPADDDGLWLARQVCDTLELRTGDDGCTPRLQVAGPHDEELRHTLAA